MTDGLAFFSETGIARTSSKSAQIISEAVPDLAFRPCTDTVEFATYLWDCTTRNNNLTGQGIGSVLELIVSATIARANIGPFVRNAESDLVPTHRMDIWFETASGTPIVISCNAKLKERWRNENLAAYALKLRVPQAKWFVVTADEHEASTCNGRISAGVVKYLDGCFTFRSGEFRSLLRTLATTELRLPSRSLDFSAVVQPLG